MQRPGVPMLPNVIGDSRTARWILLNTIVLVASSFLPSLFGYLGAVYAAVTQRSGRDLFPGHESETHPFPVEGNSQGEFQGVHGLPRMPFHGCHSRHVPASLVRVSPGCPPNFA